MALINCSECGAQISEYAPQCIHCGYILKNNNHINPVFYKKLSKRGIIMVVSVLILVAFLFVLLLNCKSKISTITNNTTTSTNEELKDSVENETMQGEGFDEDELVTSIFKKDEKVISESCEFTLTGYTISKRIEPKDISGLYMYTYYEASSGNQFIDVKFSIKNKETSGVKQSEILGQVLLIYDQKYEYRCSFVTVDKNGDFQNYTSLYNIAPLETLEYHMLVEVPDEVKNSTKSLVCRVVVDGKIYECTLR